MVETMETKLIDHHQKILNQLVGLKKLGRLAHAYLFVGPSMSGKGETALSFAQYLFCESETKSTKDNCPACQKIESGSHPDIHIIDNGYGERIKIEEVRQFIEHVKFRPFMAEQKIFIIKNVENMTLEASNALLKTLEEPSAESLIILTASALEGVIGTIRSRCHQIYFTPESNQKLEERLVSDHHIDIYEARFLAFFSQGCIGKALHFKKKEYFSFKNTIIDQFILSRNSENFIKGILSDKDKTKSLLDVLLSWARDSMLVKSAVDDERIIHIDKLLQLRKFVEGYTFDELNDLHQAIVKARKLLGENLNIKIPLMIIKEKIWLN